LKAEIDIRGLGFMRYALPCNNHCRFCSAGPKRLDNVSYDRFVSVVERFLDWRERQNLVPMIAPSVMYTHALMTFEQSRKYREMCLRGGYKPLPLQMNGCIFMPDDDLERILENHLRAGYDAYTMTLAGYGETHDLWVGRRGEFDFLMRIARVAARLGYERQEQILLSQSSVSQLRLLTDCLDALGGRKTRHIYPFTYIGWARSIEKERVTREVVKEVPQHLCPNLDMGNGDVQGRYLTEAEWAAWAGNNYPNERPRRKFLTIRVDSGNIDYLESASCDDIYIATGRGLSVPTSRYRRYGNCATCMRMPLIRGCTGCPK
jgi:hypothetical protein